MLDKQTPNEAALQKVADAIKRFTARAYDFSYKISKDDIYVIMHPSLERLILTHKDARNHIQFDNKGRRYVFGYRFLVSMDIDDVRIIIKP